MKQGRHPCWLGTHSEGPKQQDRARRASEHMSSPVWGRQGLSKSRSEVCTRTESRHTSVRAGAVIMVTSRGREKGMGYIGFWSSNKGIRVFKGGCSTTGARAYTSLSELTSGEKGC